MNNTNPFFGIRNTINKLSEEDKAKSFDYLKPIQAFARTSLESLYVIDYKKQGFEFVSENPLMLCGNTAQEVLEMGYGFYIKHVPENEQELLLTINKASLDIMDTIPLEERFDYSICYDFHLKHKDGSLALINHKLTPLLFTNKGKIWKSMCMVTLSTAKEAGNIKVVKAGSKIVHAYNIKEEVWHTIEKAELASREIEILRFSARGYTINEIADKICLSPDTVKFHRKKLFDKIEVSNITEALAYATENKLI